MENQQAEVSQNEVETVEVDQFETLKGTKFSRDSFIALLEIVREQNARIEALESKNQTSSTKREMTIEDAERVMIGDLRSKTHNEAAAELNLSYGQVYSARLGHTFKPVTVEMKKQDLKMIWGKKVSA